MQHSRIKNRSVRYVCRGLFSYYIQARSPINGQNRPPEQTKPTKPEEHPPRPKPKPILDTYRIRHTTLRQTLADFRADNRKTKLLKIFDNNDLQ